MKLLLALPRPLFPADTGGKIRTLNIFSRLAERHEISVVSLADESLDPMSFKEMKRIFRDYTPVYWKEAARFSPAFYAQFVKSRLGRFPYFLAKYCLPELRQALEAAFARGQFDLLICDFLQVAADMLNSLVHPRIIFEHNVEYQVRMRQWKAESNPAKKWILRAEWEKAKRIEAQACRDFDGVVTVSSDDQETLRREFDIQNVSSVPTGVDGDYFQPQMAEPRRGNLAFIGSMDWYPNEDGVTWFVEQIYPLIRREIPEASLTVVGRNPSPRVRVLSSKEPFIEITGRVEDVRPYLARAEVVVVPLRIGGGTRIKIFEAMAMARPVVSTTLGAEGLPVLPGREILLADSPESFARAVNGLLRDSSRRGSLARAAREKVVRDHTWEAVARKMEQILEEVLSNFSQAGMMPSPNLVGSGHNRFA